MFRRDFTTEEIILAKDELIEQLYLTNRDKFLHYAARYKVDSEVVTDIYQDAVVALFEHAKKGKLNNINSSVSTYLFAIAKFMLFTHLKKDKQLFVADENLAIEWNSYEEESKEEQVQLLQKHFDKLGEQCKKLLTAFYYEEKKLDELVVLFGYDNKDVVKSQKSRCIKQLKTLITR